MSDKNQINSGLGVSVIIPTFNRKNILSRAINSVLKQTRSADEIIIVDDGSNDGTDQLIATNYPDIRYISQENRGISSARNKGIEIATGNWIALLDSDDEWLPQKLNRQISAIQKQPEFGICHTNEIWIRHGKRVNPMQKHAKYGGFIFSKCLPLCVISPSSVLIKRNIFNEYGFFDESLPVCEDYDMWLRICAFMPVLYLEEPLIKKYGGHADQLSKKHWGMDRFRIIALEKLIMDPALSTGYRAKAIKKLIEKLSIYITGAKKRGKNFEINEFEKKKVHYLSQLASLTDTS